MRNTSTAYRSANQEQREFTARIVIMYPNRATETLTDLSRFMQIKIRDDVTSGSSFDIGSAIINEALITLNNADGHFDGRSFVGARLTVYLGIMVNGAPENLKFGEYVVVDPVTPGITIKLTAYDRMVMLDRLYTPKCVFPATLSTIARDVCSQMGVQLDNAVFPNSTYTISSYPESDYTGREIIAGIAQMAGCFARINSAGYLTFGWYGSTPATTVSGLTSKSIWTEDVTITGVTYQGSDKAKGTYGTSEYTLMISGNPFPLNQSQSNAIAHFVGQKITGMTFRPMSIKARMDLSIEAGDCITVIDEHGNSYKTLVTGTCIDLLKGQTIECSAATPEDNRSYRISSIQRAVSQLGEKSIGSTVPQYYLSTSNLTPTGGEWSTEKPDSIDGYFLWTRQAYMYLDGTLASYSEAVCTEGVSGGSSYVHVAYSNSEDGKTDFSVSDPSGRTYMGVYVSEDEDFNGQIKIPAVYDGGTAASTDTLLLDGGTSGTTDELISGGTSASEDTMLVDPDPSLYTWSLIKGETGNGIKTVTVSYQTSKSATIAPTGAWSAEPVATQEGEYLWTRTITSYTGSEDKIAYSVAAHGATGAKGEKGDDGNGISSITEYYGLSRASTVQPEDWGTEVEEMTAEYRYLWNYEEIAYTDGTVKTDEPHVIGVYGDTGETGVGIKTIENRYLVSNKAEGITLEDEGWTAEVQTTSPDKPFLWNVEIITYTDETTTQTQPCIIGTYGAKGDSGTGISTVTVKYGISEESSTKPEEWQDTLPETVFPGTYLWMWTRTELTTGDATDSFVYTYQATSGDDGASSYIHIAYANSDDGTQDFSVSDPRNRKYMGVYISDEIDYNGQIVAPANGGTASTTDILMDGGNASGTDEIIMDGGGASSTETARVDPDPSQYTWTLIKGTGVSKMVQEYCMTDSKETAPQTGWSADVPHWSYGYYVWRRTVVTYTDGTTGVIGPWCDETWEAIKEIEIGGVNMLTGTATLTYGIGTRESHTFGRSGTGSLEEIEVDRQDVQKGVRATVGAAGSAMGIYQSDVMISAGKVYTLSAWVKPSQTGMSASLQAFNGAPSEQIDLAEGWQRITYTCTAEADAKTNAGYVRIAGDKTKNPAGSYLDICAVKLEEGHIATAWTPSPDDTNAEIKEIKTALKNAQEDMAEALAAASGLYTTGEKQADGSTIYYAHNKTKLEDSNIVIKFTAEAVGISTDGGATYPYGLDVSGTAILNRIYTIGLDANYINTGELVIKDTAGNVTFSANADTGQVVLQALTSFQNEVGEFLRVDNSSGSEGVYVGQSTATVRLHIVGDRISFIDQGDQELAYFSNHQLYVAQFAVTKSANICGLTFRVSADNTHVYIS